MLNFYRPNYLALPILIVALFSLSTPALAQSLPSLNGTNNSNSNSTDLNLGISPPITYLSIKPGETKAIPLTINNGGDRDLVIQLQLAEFRSDGQTGRPVLNLTSNFPYLKPRNPAWSWGQPMVVKRDETAQIWLDLIVPVGAKLEEHHLTVLAKGSQVSPNSIGLSSVAGMVGSNIVIAIANDETDLSQVEFADWEIPRYIDSLRGIDLTGLIKNTGRQAGPVLGKASLLAPGGEILKTWLFYPDMVLPNSTREVRVIDVTSDPTAEPSTWFSQPNLQPVNHLEYKPSWLLGNYLLKLELYQQDYTPNQPRWQRVIQITAFPFGLVAFCLAIPLCYGLVSWVRSHHSFGKWLN